VSPVAARPAGGGPLRPTAAARRPKYLRIHDQLAERIASRQWPAGSPLPSQRDLADEFGVSIMTLRQALQLLADDGLIDTRHGSGTFVAARYSYDLGHLRSFAADLADQGAGVTTRLLDARVVTPPEPVAARLGSPGEVLRLRRLRLAGSRPLIVQTSYLPVPLAPAPPAARRMPPDDIVTAVRPGDRGLYALLADCGLAVTEASETITPVVLTARDARDLARPKGSPALLSHRLSITAAGFPVIDDHAVLPGDSVAVTANRSPDRLDVRYTLTAPPR
jgi:DNA-binding GntR family transcriptional regulator